MVGPTCSTGTLHTASHTHLVWPHGPAVYLIWLALFITASTQFYYASKSYLRSRGLIDGEDQDT